MPSQKAVSYSFSPKISSKKSHSALLIHKFHECKLTYSLKLMCNHKTNTAALLQSHRDRAAPWRPEWLAHAPAAVAQATPCPAALALRL